VQTGPGYQTVAGRTWIRALRWVLVAGSLAVAGVLIYRHNYVIGLLIAGLALVRVVYLVATMRRSSARRSWYGAVPGGGTGMGNPGRVPGGTGPAGTAKGRGVLAALALQEFGVAARVMGIDGIQMRRAFDEGRSIAELAAQSGVPLERIVSAVVSDATSTIEGRVSQGQMAQQQALEVKARIPVWASRLVNFHKGDMRRLRN
jgi:hypothetical protein